MLRPGQSNIIKCPFHAYLFLTYSWAELCLAQKIENTINFGWLTPRHDSNRVCVCGMLWVTQLTSDTPSVLIRPANLTATAWYGIDSSSFRSSGIRSRLANYYYKPKWRWRCHRRGEKVLMILLRSRPGTTWGAINHSRRHARATHLSLSLTHLSLSLECHLAFMACGRRQTAHVQLFYTICGTSQLLLYDVPLLLLLLLPLLRQFGVL